MAEYIEREAVIELLTNRDVVINPNDEVANIREDVECLPAADVRPIKRGEWEDVEVIYVADKTTLPFERISSMRCNQCNRYHTEIYYYGNPIEFANYCSFCGASMKEES